VVFSVDKFVANGKYIYALKLGSEFYLGNSEGGIFEIEKNADKFQFGWDNANNQAYKSVSKMLLESNVVGRE
jgi:hypothetical protein